MRERPILFSAPMVRSILEGRKTQTRRVVKNLMNDDFAFQYEPEFKVLGVKPEAMTKCPYGQTGDRLWVRESFMPAPLESAPESPRPTRWNIAFAAGGQVELLAPAKYNPTLYNYERYTPSIHMPRWASRITLEITGIRVERLQSIDTHDAINEGIPPAKREACGADSHDPVQEFIELWESINGPDAWDENPWVWVVEFQKLETKTKAAA